MLKLFIVLLAIIHFNDAFVFLMNINHKHNITPRKIHWNNVMNNFKYSKYYGKECEWNSKCKLADIKNTNNKIYYTNNKIYNLDYNNLTVFNILNNTNIYMVYNTIKINTNKFIKSNEDYSIETCVYNSLHTKCRFIITLKYSIKTKKLTSILLNRQEEFKNNNFYWSNNTKIKLLNNIKNNVDYLFGSNYKIEMPLRINKNNILNNKYPYMYELQIGNNNDKLYYKLPDNINIKIPKIIKDDITISYFWKFKNEYNFNILDINYKNNNLKDMNLFKYI